MGIVKEIIFDFDGTIANTQEVALDIANDMARDYNRPLFTIENARKSRDFTLKEVIKQLGLNRFQVARASAKFLRYLSERFDELEPITGMPQVIEVLSKDYSLGLLSSNNSDLIELFLKKYNLEFFDYVQGGAAIWGKHRKLKKIMRKRKLYKEEIVYIGDETRDIDSAKKAGVRIISVPWGYNSWKLLEERGADYIAKDPQDIIDYDF